MHKKGQAQPGVMGKEEGRRGGRGKKREDVPKSNRLLISWLQSPSTVILEPKKRISVTASTISPSICHEVMGLDAMHKLENKTKARCQMGNKAMKTKLTNMLRGKALSQLLSQLESL